MSAKILILDPDKTLLEILSSRFEKEGFQVFSFTDPITGQAILKQENIDIIITELYFSEINGLNLLQQIKRESLQIASIPIVITTTSANLSDKLKTFEIGINDYLLKPFHLDELIARIKALLKYKYNIQQLCQAGSGNSQAINENMSVGEILHAGEITLLPESREAKFSSNIIHFTPIEFEIISCLMQNIGKTISPNYLIHQIWGHDSSSDDIETIRVHIRHLRQRLDESINKGKDKSEPKLKYIRTIYGKGYQLIPEGFTAI